MTETLTSSSFPFLLGAGEHEHVDQLVARFVEMREILQAHDDRDAAASRALLARLDDVRLRPLEAPLDASQALWAVLDRFAEFRDTLPDGSAVLEAREAVETALAQPDASLAPVQAEALERAAVALGRVHGEPVRGLQDALDQFAVEVRSAPGPASLVALSRPLLQALDALACTTAQRAEQAFRDGQEVQDEIRAAAQGVIEAGAPAQAVSTLGVEAANDAASVQGPDANAPLASEEGAAEAAQAVVSAHAVVKADSEAASRRVSSAAESPQGERPAPAQAEEPQAPVVHALAPVPAQRPPAAAPSPVAGRAPGAREEHDEQGDWGERRERRERSGQLASETPGASAPADSPIAPAASGDRAQRAAQGAPRRPEAQLLRRLLADEAKGVSDEALLKAIAPDVARQAAAMALTAAHVEQARAVLRTHAKTLGLSAAQVDRTIALEALVRREQARLEQTVPR